MHPELPWTTRRRSRLPRARPSAPPGDIPECHSHRQSQLRQSRLRKEEGRERSSLMVSTPEFGGALRLTCFPSKRQDRIRCRPRGFLSPGRTSTGRRRRTSRTGCGRARPRGPWSGSRTGSSSQSLRTRNTTDGRRGRGGGRHDNHYLDSLKSKAKTPAE